LTFDQAVQTCHVRSAIFRKGHALRFWKNHEIPLGNRVPLDDQNADDWEEFDPHDDDPYAD